MLSLLGVLTEAWELRLSVGCLLLLNKITRQELEIWQIAW